MRKRTNYIKIFFVTAVFALAIYASIISAQTPAGAKISIQGKLSDANGKPLDGNFQLKFDFLNAANNALVKTVGPQSVSVSKGFFTAQIDPSGMNFNMPYLVDVYVEGQKLSPSFWLTYAPYSLRAANADSASSAGSAASADALSASCSGCVSNSHLGTGVVDNSKIAANAVANSNLQAGAVTLDKLAANSVDSTKIVNGAVGIDDINFIAGGKKSGQNSYGITFSSDSQYGRKSSFSSGVTPIVVCSSFQIKTYCVVNQISNTGFTAFIYDNGGNPTTSDIDWIAIGS